MLLSILRREGAGIFTPEGLRSFLAAALMHDLGHFPYTHSLKELPLEEHEVLTARIIAGPSLRQVIAATGADPDRAAAIVDHGLPADDETRTYRSILSGVLDPDKLDYLSRDAYYCGVPYGLQDLDFVLSRIRQDGPRGIGIDSKGVPSIEHILFSKYLMYRSVYWHRDVRAATSMVKKALASALASGRLAAEELYALDDESLRGLVARMGPSDGELLGSVLEGRLLPCRAEIPYDPGQPSLAGLESLDARTKAETRIEEALAAGAPRGLMPRVVIDLPEAVSFDSDVRVTDLDRDFRDVSSLFTRRTVSTFTGALRVMRVFASENIPESLLPMPARIEHAD
jgi:HD superfamily phosphohydrolase